MSTAISIQTLKQTLSEKGVRQTKKRDLILETFLEMGGHRTIDELWNEVKKKDSNIGYVTVYRTLRLLKECGLAHQWQFGDGFSRFEQAADHHDHLICMKCGKIIEFEDEEIESLQEKIIEAHHFKMVSHLHEIYGYCSQCS